ncbi:hypothetical protein A4R44_04786 [Amycolatopsis sp. M39]|uniref:DUF6292 domain-containing protein n=1 Tax=Amycolatopsis rubida TaxID=112413 RepID=A0A1I6ARB8_9PSEU|nr:hypothetical protein A4R44_04786 [Amycolatopsis sp. M39]SFQ71288.1 hypothetical protein SAMN05421854_120110 [Amycolatopsis rubida]
MSLPLHTAQTGSSHPASVRLWNYLAEVTGALGIGLESCTVDHDTPVSAYVALDGRLPAYPGRDVALLWDEIHGWAAAVETHSGEDLIVIRYLAGPSVAPPASRVAEFAAAVRDDDHRIGCLAPPGLRTPGTPADLDALLRDAG